jgi:hypothetical protein
MQKLTLLLIVVNDERRVWGAIIDLIRVFIGHTLRRDAGVDRMVKFRYLDILSGPQ